MEVRSGARRRRREKRRRILKALKIIVTTAFLFAVAMVGFWGYNQVVHGRNEVNEANEIISAQQLKEKIIDNVEQVEYPEELLELLETNPETKDFVEGYPDREEWTGKDIILTKEEQEETAPLFLQWDKRWGYSLYGGKMMAINGCGPTCLSMVLVGLRDTGEMNPLEVAKYSEAMGYITEAYGTDWALMTMGAAELGLDAKEISLDKNVIINTLNAGCQIICSMGPGDFTTTGHFIVIYGSRDGKLLVHDPNSRERSEKEWEFENIKGQIKNLWRYM